jgi:hypothetical protein
MIVTNLSLNCNIINTFIDIYGNLVNSYKIICIFLLEDYSFQTQPPFHFGKSLALILKKLYFNFDGVKHYQQISVAQQERKLSTTHVIV